MRHGNNEPFATMFGAIESFSEYGCDNLTEWLKTAYIHYHMSAAGVTVEGNPNYLTVVEAFEDDVKWDDIEELDREFNDRYELAATVREYFGEE